MSENETKKLKVSRAVLCEGKYDKIKLSSVIDGMILTTDGFSVFNNAEKKALLKKLCETRGLAVITDSDKAGMFIRSKLKGILGGGENIVNIYIPQIKGREKRKSKDSKEGLLGVEGMQRELLFDILEKSGIGEDAVRDDIGKEYLTKTAAYELGLSGKKDSAQAREKVCLAFGLPSTLGTNALIEALYMLGISQEDVMRALDMKNDE